MSGEILKYHLETSYDRREMKGAPLDWAHQPDTFKKYPVDTNIALGNPGFANTDHILSLSKKKYGNSSSKKISLDDLSSLLLLGFNITAVTRFQEKNFYYRCMPSAGALYPNEIYIAVYDVQGIEPGVYHYMIKEKVLVPIREGSCQSNLASFVPLLSEKKISASLIISGIFFRTTWKYRKRGYRYVLNDAGHLVENIYLSGLFSGFDSFVSYDFNDDRLNEFMGFDSRKEVSLAIMHFPGENESVDLSGPSTQIERLSEEMISASKVSKGEIDYRDILSIHSKGNVIYDNADVIERVDWVEGIDIPDIDARPDMLGYPETILKRRSKRNFITEQIPAGDFSLMLHLLCDCFDSEAGGNMHGSMPSVGFLANNIEGYENGYYLIDPIKRRTKLMDGGSFSSLSSAICLNQQWLENAAVHFLFMADLAETDRLFGARGYRYLMMNAGRLGHRVYLGATSLGLGSCGIGALFDFEAQEMLDLPENTFLLYLVAAGPVKKI